MKILNLKQMTIAAMLGTSLLLTGCGGGSGGGGSVTPVADPLQPVEPPVNNSISGNLSVGSNLTEGTNPDTLGSEDYLSAVKVLLPGVIDSTTIEQVYGNLNLGSSVKDAHDAGWTGLGVNVSVLDFGRDDPHGLNVELLTRAVAPGANFDILDVDSNPSLQEIKNSLSTADVFTTSVGTSPANGGDDLDVIKALEDSDAVVTVAAQHSNWIETETHGGRTGRGGFTDCDYTNMTVANCNTWAVSGLGGDNIIFVGEVDSADLIPVWSNQAGEAHKNDFLVTRSNSLSGTDGVGGNSFAAPRVAGAVALVAHKFPNTNADDRKLIILNTADDLGATGVDAVYGHGLLNVGAALSPVGNLH